MIVLTMTLAKGKIGFFGASTPYPFPPKRPLIPTGTQPRKKSDCTYKGARVGNQ